MAVRVTVVGQYDGRSLAAAQRDLDKLKRAQLANAGPMGKMAAGLKQQLTPNFMAMGAAVAAAGAALAAFAIKLGVDGVTAAAQEEQALIKLQTALNNVGQGYRLAELETFVDGMQRATGVADDELRPALQTLVTATGNATQAQELLTLALDISVASGKDLTTVSAALAKAANGQFTQISRLTNGALNPSILATKDLKLITGELTRLFGGQAEANAQTFAGKIEILKIAFDELLESFGEGFIDGFTSGADVTGDLGNAFKAAEPGMREFGQTVGDLGRILSYVAPLIDNFVNLFKYAIPTALAAAAAAFPPLIPVVGWITTTFLGSKAAVDAYADSVDIVGVKFTGPMSQAAQSAMRSLGGVEGSAEDAETAFDQLNDQMDRFFGFMDEREAVRGYEQAVDDLAASLKENGKNFDTNTEAGRKNEEALDGVYAAALDVAEGQATAAEKVATMEAAAREAKKQLDKTNMSEDAKQRLLQPFDDAIAKFDVATTKVSNLKQEMEKLPEDKTITITVDTRYSGKPVPTGATGGLITGPGSGVSDSIPMRVSNGEFIIRAASVRQFGADFFSALNAGVNPMAGSGAPGPTRGGTGSSGGFSVGSITVNAAPGERAEETVPRALRRMAFLAGV